MIFPQAAAPRRGGSVSLRQHRDGLDLRTGLGEFAVFEVVQLWGAAGREEDDQEIIIGASTDADAVVPGYTETREDLVQGEAVVRQDGVGALWQGSDIIDHGVDRTNSLEIVFGYPVALRQRNDGFDCPAELAGDKAGKFGVGQHLGQQSRPALAGLGQSRIISRSLLKMPGDVEGGYRTRFRQGGGRLSTGEEEGQQVDGICDVDHSVGVDVSSADRGEVDGQRDPVLVANADAGQETEEEYEQDG